MKKQKKDNSKIICEARHDKSIYYYFNNDQYEIFINTMDRWDRHTFGKFSVSKCLEFLIKWDEEFGMDYNFSNIKKVGTTNINPPILGKSPSYIFSDGLYDLFVNGK